MNTYQITWTTRAGTCKFEVKASNIEEALKKAKNRFRKISVVPLNIFLESISIITKI